MGADIVELGADTDEGVGSLPLVVAPDNGKDDHSKTLKNYLALTGGQSQSSILITGTWEDARAVVIDSFGDGFIYVAPTQTTPQNIGVRPTAPPAVREPADSETQFDFRFYGDIELELDIVELERRGIVPELRTPDDFHGGLSTVCSGNLCSPIATLPSSSKVSFSLGDLLSSNVLLEDGVQLFAVAANMNAIKVSLSLSSASTLKIVQGMATTSSK